MPDKPKQLTDRLRHTLRLSRPLSIWLQVSASRNQRSMNAEITHQLEQVRAQQSEGSK
jgi:hypothetical protein